MPGGEENLGRSLEAGGRLEARQLLFDLGPGVLALNLGDAGKHPWSAPHESRPKRTQPATLGIPLARDGADADIAEAGSGERIPDDTRGSEARTAEAGVAPGGRRSRGGWRRTRCGQGSLGEDHPWRRADGDCCCRPAGALGASARGGVVGQLSAVDAVGLRMAIDEFEVSSPTATAKRDRLRPLACTRLGHHSPSHVGHRHASRNREAHGGASGPPLGRSRCSHSPGEPARRRASSAAQSGQRPATNINSTRAMALMTDFKLGPPGMARRTR